ncbi:hypothetical protein [Mycobacterium camsae]|uniref:hypothetical protein n=1 Tax=Mycobacterium gordonae TaxID=1778 RepID=UPI0019800A1F|nr:hypothetical protein [Mycobacterium gordonae]
MCFRLAWPTLRYDSEHGLIDDAAIRGVDQRERVGGGAGIDSDDNRISLCDDGHGDVDSFQ